MLPTATMTRTRAMASFSSFSLFAPRPAATVTAPIRSRRSDPHGQTHHHQQQQRQQQQHGRGGPSAAAAAADALPPPTSRRSSAVEPLPQNTGQALALPTPSLTALEAASAQLDALSSPNLDRPWPFHGVQVAYAFCADAGALEMSRYFAPLRTSLYHQDHFQGKFLSRFPGLVGHGGWELEAEGIEGGEEDEVVEVRASVRPSSASPGAGAAGAGAGDERQTYVLVMVRQEAGLRKGSWVTKQLVRLGPDGAPL